MIIRYTILVRNIIIEIQFIILFYCGQAEAPAKDLKKLKTINKINKVNGSRKNENLTTKIVQ